MSEQGTEWAPPGKEHAPEPVVHEVHARADDVHERLVVHQDFDAAGRSDQLVKFPLLICGKTGATP